MNHHFDTQIQTCTNSDPRVSCLFSTVGSKFLHKCQFLLLVILLIITVCYNIFFSKSINYMLLLSSNVYMDFATMSCQCFFFFSENESTGVIARYTSKGT